MYQVLWVTHIYSAFAMTVIFFWVSRWSFSKCSYFETNKWYDKSSVVFCFIVVWQHSVHWQIVNTDWDVLLTKDYIKNHSWSTTGHYMRYKCKSQSQWLKWSDCTLKHACDYWWWWDTHVTNIISQSLIPQNHELVTSQAWMHTQVIKIEDVP